MISYPVEYRATDNFGGGLFATSPIAPGQLVASFDGDFWTWGDSVANLPNESPNYTRDHTIQFGPGQSRDSGNGMGRFANHSCDPNCGIKNLFDIVAMKSISPGEQIMWDYAMTENNDWFMLCRCGSRKCRRIITGYRNLPPDVREAYRGFISQWLIDAKIPYEGPATMPVWREFGTDREFLPASAMEAIRAPRAS